MFHHSSADDVAFRRSFESCQVSPADFDHAAHVRLAYVYLCEGSVDAAAERTKNAILAFLRHIGVSASKYHETLTRSWIMAVEHFMKKPGQFESAADFMHAHPALLDSKIMLTHYSTQVLFSPEARASFVAPDIRPIPPP